MKALFKGIYDLWLTANTFRTALTGGFHLNNAPQGTALPYGVYWLVSDITDFDFTSVFDTHTIQIDIIESADGFNSIGDLYDKCLALFDDCTLTVTGYQFLGMERQFVSLGKDSETEVWHAVIQYEINIRKDL